MPRWLRQPRHGGRASYYRLTLASDSDPRHVSRVGLLAQNQCAGAKIKAVGKKAKCLLGLEAKEAAKGVAPDPAKVQKCQDKLVSAFTKAEAKGGCTTTGDAAAIEAKVDAFVADVADELPSGVSTTPSLLLFVTGTPGGACGTTQDGSSAVIKSLTCGGLNLGGGSGIVPESPWPDGSQSRFSLACVGSACTIGAISTAPAVNTAAPDCSDTGCNFGTPLPIPNPGLPILSACVLNTFNSPATGSLDLSTGASTINVNLSFDYTSTSRATWRSPARGAPRPARRAAPGRAPATAVRVRAWPARRRTPPA
jgi:hypothetical protein